MYDLAIMWDWAAFAVRWLHVITAIAWIGSSFYFIALDLGLRKVPHLPVGAHGEHAFAPADSPGDLLDQKLPLFRRIGDLGGSGILPRGAAIVHHGASDGIYG